jgi:hypothetical protein
MAAPLKYISDLALKDLRKAVESNIDRYLHGNFQDLADTHLWDINLGLDFDKELLATLDTSKPRNIAPIDLKNSKIVGTSLSQLSGSLANEERIWVRLAHVDALEYCRARWLTDVPSEKVPKEVEKHFFAVNQTGIRDDQAISRLWWNYRIATLCMPEEPDTALSLILKSADIRSNFVERIWLTSRRPIASATLRAMQRTPWITETEDNFRKFMKSLNKLGGGIVFESLSPDETDAFVSECAAYTRASIVN